MEYYSDIKRNEVLTCYRVGELDDCGVKGQKLVTKDHILYGFT